MGCLACFLPSAALKVMLADCVFQARTDARVVGTVLNQNAKILQKGVISCLLLDIKCIGT